MVEVADEPKLNKDKLGLMIPYTAQREVLESFEADDTVLLSKKKDGKTFELGAINVRKSTKSELYLVITNKAKGINPEDQLYLQSSSTRSSFTRRKKAMERILERLSVVPQLVDYFDEACDIEPQRYGEAPTEEHFEVYQRQMPDGQIIGLNDAQKEAFARLVSRGPLGLLQGPPGTGKTWLAKRLAKGLFPTGLSHRFISEHFSTTGRSPASRTPDLSRVGELVMKYKDIELPLHTGSNINASPT